MRSLAGGYPGTESPLTLTLDLTPASVQAAEVAKRSPAQNKAESVALIAAATLGIPLILLVVGALGDGLARAGETPLSAILGQEAYLAIKGDPEAKAFARGLHYLAPDDPTARKLAPDFSLPDRHGNVWRLSEQRGKKIILNFWSITCRPCLEEMPSLIDLGQRLVDRKDVALVTISTDRNWDEVKTLFGQSGPPPFTILFDPEKQVTRDRFGTKAYPETWFIDEDGVVQLRIDGPRDWSEALVLDVVDLI